MKNKCGIYEIMREVVLLWVQDSKLSLTTKQYADLWHRLQKAEKDLNHKYQCKKANRIKMETIGER